MLSTQTADAMTALEFNYHLGEVSHSLRPFAFKLTRDLDDANDLLQETLMKAFLNRDKFATGTNLKAWLYTIMKNTFITNYQRLVRRNAILDTTDSLHYFYAPDGVAQNLALGSFIQEDATKALDSLDEIYRTPFTLYYKGYKYHEIADHLRIPIGTVKNRIHIARKELKKLLDVYAPN